jgi:hypothetical protein
MLSDLQHGRSGGRLSPLIHHFEVIGYFFYS